jgi:hypothetical protein
MGAAKATATPAAEEALNTSRRFPIVKEIQRGNTVVEIVFIEYSTGDVSDTACYMYEWSWN